MGTSDTDPLTTKAAARAEARGRRRDGEPVDPHALADQVIRLLGRLPGPQRVTCYASFGTEPDTGPLRRRLAESGYEVLLPRVNGDMLEWIVDGEDSVISRMGIEEPVGPGVDLLPLRALLIPALAVTPHGDRLGKGGGYYDRTLASLGSTPPPIVAIVGEQDIQPSLPTEAHDQRVDVIVAPTRVIYCARD